MEINFSAIFNLLTQSPGDLIYHLVVSLALILVLVSAAHKRLRAANQEAAKHLIIGTSVLLLLQLLLFGVRFLPNFEISHLDFLIGTVERAASALTITWLTWTFIENQKSSLLTWLAAVISLVVILLAAASLFLGTLLPADVAASLQRFLLIWEVTAFALILACLIAILIKKPAQWGVAVGILLAIACGYLMQRLTPNTQTNQMGAVRLAQALTLPWIIATLQRVSRPTGTESASDNNQAPVNGEKRVDPKPTLIDQLLQIPLQETAENKYRAIARAVSLSVISDICYLVRIPKEANQVQLLTGYDLIREEFLPAKTLERAELLHIMGAWEEGHSLTLSDAQANTRDAVTFTLLLRYHRIGNLLAFPLSLPDQPLAGGVIFLSPYTGKNFGEDTVELLNKIKNTLAQVLFTVDPIEKLKTDLERSHLAQSALTQDKEILTRALAQMGSAVEIRENAIKQLKAKFQIEKLEIVKQLDECQAKLRTLAAQAAAQKDYANELEQSKTEMRQLNAERDQLRTELKRANARIKDLENQSGQTGPIRLSVENQVLSLDAIAANARLGAAAKLSQKGIILEILNPDGRQIIRTDPLLLQSILSGLLDNAIQASEPGNKIQLSQALSLETGMLIIQVTDLGEGLTQEEQRILFNGDQSAIPGIGSIQAIREAIRAIRLLNGKIWIKSQKNEFTTFRVQLPVRIID